MLILAIESSCDETAVAVLDGAQDPPRLLASEISSQIEIHRATGGVVPEVASRNHSLRMRPLIEAALQAAGRSLHEIDGFAATAGPGLASSLLIGNTTAKALALAAGKPFLAINHMEGHLLSPFIDVAGGPVPHLALIVSGGHTMLVDVRAVGDYRLLGRTRDDAAGEAFDKVAKMLGLAYPGGPEVEKHARHGDPSAFALPRSMLRDPHLDFSFSGLKTAVLYTLTDLDPAAGVAPPGRIADLCASFQAAVVEILVTKTLRAARQSGHKLVSVSGGVSCNGALRAAMTTACAAANLDLRLASPAMATDNAAMIAYVALLRHRRGEASELTTDIDPNLPLG
jgi:N6-L-threonylcarbamoyladenine synthase